MPISVGLWIEWEPKSDWACSGCPNQLDHMDLGLTGQSPIDFDLIFFSFLFFFFSFLAFLFWLAQPVLLLSLLSSLLLFHFFLVFCSLVLQNREHSRGEERPGLEDRRHGAEMQGGEWARELGFAATTPAELGNAGGDGRSILDVDVVGGRARALG